MFRLPLQWTMRLLLVAAFFYESVKAFTLGTSHYHWQQGATSAARVCPPSSVATTGPFLLGVIATSESIHHNKKLLLHMSSSDEEAGGVSQSQVDEVLDHLSEDEKLEMVGNLLADDEWMGVSMELTELVRTAVIEDVKKNARDFLGKDEYKLGDLSKEIDTRVKDSVAEIRSKEEYEIGDFCLAMDEMSKQMTEELTGKPYEAGDLSIELDKRIKSAVADFCDTEEEYEFGDLSQEINRRVQQRVEDYTGKPYEFGDVSRAIEEQRQQWIKDVLGEDAAANYQFGDLTKNAIQNFTGKDDYQFGDVTKKLMGNIFGKRKKGGDS